MSLEESARQIIEFVRTNEAWAPPIVFALAFGESLAFVSLILPAWAALLGIGALIGAGGIDFVPVWIAGSIGAALGDWLSYWIGTKFKSSIAGVWPLSRHPDLLPKGVHKTLGCPGDLHWPVLWSVARLGAARRRHLRDAVLAVPVRQLHVGVSLGRRAAVARRRWGEGHDLAVERGDREVLDVTRVAVRVGTRRREPGFQLAACSFWIRARSPSRP
jgi:hypothetical protein